jgi:hypothetical protein
MFTIHQKLANRIVRRMHSVAGIILDAADVIENRIVFPEK